MEHMQPAKKKCRAGAAKKKKNAVARNTGARVVKSQTRGYKRGFLSKRAQA